MDSSAELVLLAAENGIAVNRHLQFEIPAYTSPPLPVALALTPEPYRSDEFMEEVRNVAAAGNCTIDGNRCHIPFPVVDFSNRFEGSSSKVGVVFYNGALVDPRGYAPLVNILNERYGIPAVMPIFASDLAFVMGVCDSSRLDYAKAEFPEVEKWVLAGHSFGGVAAMVDFWTRWNTETPDDDADGLVLLAADVQTGLGCGDTNFTDTNIPMAQIFASNDGILNMTRVNLNRFRNAENTTFFVDIDGANHASFGAYNDSERFDLFGRMDGEQSIPSEIVWDMAAAAIANVAARTGVELPTPISSSGAALYSSAAFSLRHSLWSTLLFFGLLCSTR